MRRGRILIVVALILILCVVAAYFLTRGPLGGGGAAQETQAPQDVAFLVIAAQDIPRGTLITQEYLRDQVPFPSDSVVETMITDANQVVGFWATQDIARGIPITQGMLTKVPGSILEGGSAAAIAIPRGQTAIAIPITRLSSVAYAIRPGDRVDVLASMLLVDLDTEFQSLEPNETMIMLGTVGENLTAFICTELKQTDRGPECVNPVPPPFGKLVTDESSEQPLYAVPSEPQRPRMVTQRLIDYATVLHVGTFALEAEEAAASAPLTAAQGVGAPPPQTTGPQTQAAVPTIVRPDIVTLIVSPQDALALNWALKSGVDLVLTLRAPGDTSNDATTSVTLQYLLDTYDITVPSKQPYGIEPRIDRIVVPVLPNDAVPAPAGP